MAWRWLILLIALTTIVPRVRVASEGLGQNAPAVDPLHHPLDQILDLYVRDGFVYYAALKAERARLDRYVASLDGPTTRGDAVSQWSQEQQVAFWLNAYDAFVLRTVIDHYPIRGSAAAYPTRSIRQIPGAFDRIAHHTAGRRVTLDQIENQILPTFRDPRTYLALGRGAVGSGRLRSEAFTAARLDTQLKQASAEFVTRPDLVQIDQLNRRILVSPIVGWHEVDFVAAYGSGAAPRFKARSPIERAVVALLEPNALSAELDFLRKNEFAVSYREFDWHLNDLTGGRQ